MKKLLPNLSVPRFEFGKNWESYSNLVDEERLSAAVTRLSHMLKMHDLHGKSFLDIGCGSGLHALAALRMGAEKVLAIDLDATSVKTTQKIINNS